MNNSKGFFLIEKIRKNPTTVNLLIFTMEKSRTQNHKNNLCFFAYLYNNNNIVQNTNSVQSTSIVY